MRIPRSVLLPENDCCVHMVWRAHNKEFYLQQPSIKKMYLDAVARALIHCEHKVSISSFCVMDNHYHQVIRYDGSSENLSKFMRSCHTSFGIRYNRLVSRSGKVAEDRPKTPLIQDDHHEMMVHFYVESNPIRTVYGYDENKLIRNNFSSFGYLAYGRISKFSKLITLPNWYLALGKSPKQRQRKYRELFFAYLANRTVNEELINDLFIGNTKWVQLKMSYISELKNNEREQNTS